MTMKLVVDTTQTTLYCFLNKEHKHISLYAGKNKNGQWKRIIIKESVIPNCITLTSFDDNSAVLEIPKNLIQKGIVSAETRLVLVRVVDKKTNGDPNNEKAAT